mmetsp:Transcript_4616/g.8707  ORF Transcript_4616/g.8707 Transcript_4616/m.8707 type:complete len:81 (+) Transcript_4616:13-255(+)
MERESDKRLTRNVSFEAGSGVAEGKFGLRFGVYPESRVRELYDLFKQFDPDESVSIAFSQNWFLAEVGGCVWRKSTDECF